MKKILLIGALAAVGAGAYIFNQQQSSSTNNVLEYIPADTPIFAAQLQPFPLKDYIKSAPQVVDTDAQQTIEDLHPSASEAEKFFFSLAQTYQSNLSDADLLIKTFGLPDEVRVYFYTLGLSPVLKFEVANEQAVWDLLDKTELETGFKHKEGTLQGIQYRAYPLTDETDPVNAEMIVAINNGLLTVTLNTAYSDETLLLTALGLTKVSHSLADTGTVKELINKHKLKEASLAFINHIEIVKGLTTKDGNQLAKQITSLEGKLGSHQTIEQFTNTQCASELTGIVSNWPRTVAGYSELKITPEESTIATKIVVESNNNVILDALTALRGFVPQYTNNIDDNVFTMGLGLDINQLASSLTTILSDLQTPSYQCQPLAEIQGQFSELSSSVAMLSMGTGMMDGFQGISLGLLDYTLSDVDSSPKLDSLDSLLTISSENPEQLFNTAKMFLPELQQVQLTATSEPVELNTILPIPQELNIAPKLAIKGKHLVIYNGDKGAKAADALSTEALEKNGLYNLSFDFKKMVTPLFTATELTGESIPEEAMFLTDYDARMLISLDINPQGLIMKSKINNKAPQSN